MEAEAALESIDAEDLFVLDVEDAVEVHEADVVAVGDEAVGELVGLGGG